jgi:orotidine-5'-phosphate decarboxylase
MNKPSDTQIIVALDVADESSVSAVLKKLNGAISFYKVGLELFTAAGPAILNQLREQQVFLDLKLHDIPRTVERAVHAAALHRVRLMTVHAGGGRDMLHAAAKAAQSAAGGAMQLLAVTTLTSMNEAGLREVGVSRPLQEHVLALGCMAIECGIDGLVCSALEAAAFRRALGAKPVIVTPGIRPAGAERGDQKRVATPAEAVRAGADYIVVGRPILDAPDPRVAADRIAREISEAR